MNTMYVSELLFTYNSNPRQHIWIFTCGCSERDALYLAVILVLFIQIIIPFLTIFGNKYYCESGFIDYPNSSATMLLYFNDTLWYREGC